MSGGRNRRGRRWASPRARRRQAFVAVPVAGLALALFAQAANNDLSVLDAGGTAPTSTSTTAGFSTITTDVTATTDVTDDEAGTVGGGAVTTTVDGADPNTAAGGLPPVTTGTPGTGTPDTGIGSDGTPPTTSGETVGGSAEGSDPDQTGPAVTGDGPGTTTPGQADGQTSPDQGSDPAAGGEDAGGDTAGGDTAGREAAGGDATGGEAAAGNETGPPARTGAGDGGTSIVGLLRTLATALVLAASAAGLVYLSLSLVQGIVEARRRSAADGSFDDDDPTGASDPAALAVIDPTTARWTLDQLRQRLQSDPDPRSAIRQAYAAVETGFGAGGGLARRQSETPLQYLERSLGAVEGSAQPLRVLTGLFLLARYSNRPMNEAMRQTAITAVLDLQASYRRAESAVA